MPGFPTKAEVEAVIPVSRLPYIRAQQALMARNITVRGNSETVSVQDGPHPRAVVEAIRGLVRAEILEPPLPAGISDILGQMTEVFDQPHLKGVLNEGAFSREANMDTAVLALQAAVDHGTRHFEDNLHILDPVWGPHRG